MSGQDDWFRRWFGREYLELYPHRDEEEAERAVALLEGDLEPDPQLPALDLACGAGRHLGPLRAAGFEPVGLDLSRPLLAEARRRMAGAVRLVRADMRRLPFSVGVFGTVVQFFTSFGYFETEEEDRRVLEEVCRVLVTGGSFLMDFLNADRVREELVPEDVRSLEGRTVRQFRRIEEDRVVKRIEIAETGKGGGPRVYHERVRLYTPERLEAMLADAGLRVRRRFGDYDGRLFTSGSPRLILGGTSG